MASEYRCVGCGIRVKSLFIQYSPGNIRLMKCGNCKEVADEYIECERMIIFIDLILHRPKVYRHVLYNAINPENVNIQHLLWKLVFVYLLLDSYRGLLLRRTDENSSFSESSVLISVKVLIGVLSANAAFIFSFALAAKGFLNEVSRRRDIILGLLISSYFKIFLLAMLVWEFPMAVIFIVDILVVTSNSMALKVMTETTTSRCIGVCLMAHLVRFLVGQIFEPTTLLTQFGSVTYLSSLFRIV
ncbi:Protein ARV 1 [Cardamine amara subsp. amara]|uniref:Protein ARV n=1 Tax=Cardamine amara subsp. amara TaxID=228776 RepID=A0ABD1BT30_CARAN